MTPRTAPYGTWTSVVQPKYISQQFTSIEDVIVDPVTSAIYHIECRPHEGGRYALVESTSKTDVTWDAFDIQTHVNSYGGAAAAVHKDIVYFNNWRDHRVYMQHLPSKEAVPLTPAHAPYRFAYFVTHPIQKHIVFTVVEDHTDPSPDGIRTYLAYIDTRRGTLHRLLSGADFYTSPLVSPAGNKIAWLEWNHPYMPWQGAQLWLGELTFSEGQMSLHNKNLIDGNPGAYAVHEFHWISNLCIVFMSDKNRYIEPFVYQLANARRTASLHSVFMEENSLHSDFADPAWVLGNSHYALLDDSDQNICVTIKEGRSYLNYINIETRELDQMDSPYLDISRLRRVDDNTLVFIGGSVMHSPSVIQVTFDREWRPPAPKFKVLAGPNEPFLDKVFKAAPRTIKIPKVNGKFTYAHYYAPTNPDFVCEGEKPPCIVSLHSEPISRTQLGFQWPRTYYTSHGFGWLDIDCCGSTGYGKDYRKRIDGNYGILDIEDILDATEYCALDHRFDRNRVCLRATGQGAYLALQIMADYPESFRAAAVHNMNADMSRMPRSSSKLTRHHLRHLMGGRPEQIPDTYARRNPLNRIHYIQRPFFISHMKSGPTFYQAQQVLDIILDKGGQVKHAFFDDNEHDHVAMYESMYQEEMMFVRFCLVTLMGRVGPTVYDPVTRQTSYLPPLNVAPSASHR